MQTGAGRISLQVLTLKINNNNNNNNNHHHKNAMYKI
jgi:hypothetical protein